MKSSIVVYSYHHKNTKKIARAIAEELNADVKYPSDIAPATLQDFDLIGFGAGIDSGKHYQPMLAFAEALPAAVDKVAFIFSTSAIYSKKKMTKDHATLRKILAGKGYHIIDEYACTGFNANSVLKYWGGMNKGKPDENDIHAAKTFAKSVLKKCAQENGGA